MAFWRLVAAFAGAAALVGALACAERERPGSRPDDLPPNLLIAVLDTLRADRLGLYGHPRETSPHLDALARRCVVFDAAQSASPWTAPSLLTLMTSLHPDVHEVKDFPVPRRMGERIRTLAEVLKERGYATAAITEGGYARGDYGLDQGFDEFPPEDGGSSQSTGRLERNVDRALAWMRRSRGRPFFLLLHTYEPHAPYAAPAKYVARFRAQAGADPKLDRAAVERTIERWNRERRVEAGDFEQTLRYHYRHGLHDLPYLEESNAFLASQPAPGVSRGAIEGSTAFREWIGDLYDADVAWMDASLARLWQGLDELDLRRHTIVVVTSDHGEGLGDHQTIEHGTHLHEELLRIALLICPAGDALAPRRVSEGVRTQDVMPTVLELLGIPAADLPMQGRSLVPLMGGGTGGWPAFGQALAEAEPDRLRSVRTKRWRLVVEPGTGRRWLYDRERDPGETFSVARSHPRVVAHLTQMLQEQERKDAALRQRLGAKSRPGPLDDAALEQLRALGYAVDSKPAETE